MRLIRSKNYRRMPWKNGGGETIEIAAYPLGASTDDFDWRVSMAKVEHDGPFSKFPDIDRTLTILDGQGIELSVDAAAPVRIADRPYSFAGDLRASAKLLDGPVLDLNVMTRRGRYGHRVTPIDLAGTKEIVVMSPVALLYCHGGDVTIAEEFAEPFALDEGNTLYIEAMPNGLTLTATRPARLYLIEIGPARS